jgi:hypothetical protein
VSRFSDPRRLVERNRFGVLYLGASLKVCFAEAILRDNRDGLIADFEIPESDLAVFHYAEIQLAAAVTLVDLREDGPIRMGVPSDVTGSAAQTLARAWSMAFHEHSTRPDGIIYPSRLNEETNLAIYGRAVPKLMAVRILPLLNAPDLGRVLAGFRVAII